MPMQEAHRLRAELADVKQESDQQEQRLHHQLQSLQHSLDQARAQNTALENRSGCIVETLIHDLPQWGCSSYGRALALHARGTGFNSLHLQGLICLLTTCHLSVGLLRKCLTRLPKISKLGTVLLMTRFAVTSLTGQTVWLDLCSAASVLPENPQWCHVWPSVSSLMKS